MTHTDQAPSEAQPTLTSDELLTYGQAGDVTGQHKDTIKTHRENGRYPNAIQKGGRKTW